MFGGGGGLNPRKMKQMMEQMGIEVEEIAAAEVVIRTDEGDLVFPDPDVTRMDARGQQTYQIVGEPEERAGGADEAAGEASEAGEASGTDDAGDDLPYEEGDVDLVVERTGAGEDAAREALAETGGDIAAAIDRLE